MIRVGLGYDLHKLVFQRKLVLGGVEIPFEKGEDGHSDGDVLFHAITDAISGAAGLGDIGSYFPPEDSKWKDADSAFLLKSVMKDVYAAGWKIENLDCVIKLEKPKFIPFRNDVINSIAKTLQINTDQVFVKLGDVGSGNAIEAYCCCLLSKDL